MSNVTEQILIGAAGNALGGPPGQLAGFGIVKFLKGSTVAYKKERGGEYMTEMQGYMIGNKQFLSLEEREILLQIENLYVPRLLYTDARLLMLL